MQRTIEPSEQALMIAARNGERDYFNYEIEDWGHDGYMVSHKKDKGRAYFVDLSDASCQCPAFEKMGICKHLWIVGETLRIDEMANESDLNWEAIPGEYASPDYRRF
jgi:hypothetical protein